MVIDPDAALAQAGGDPALLAEIADLFLRECPAWLSRIDCAINSEDRPALTIAAHTLKGAVRNFEARRALELLEQLESIGRAGDLTHARDVFAALKCEIGQVELALTGLTHEPAVR